MRLPVHTGHSGDNLPLVIDPTKNGLEKVLRDYQIEAMKLIWAHNGAGMTSREVYDATNNRLGAGKSVSRASIINFLNAMCDEGILDYEEETCKGGMRRKYKKGLDEKGFKKYIASEVLSSLMSDFPNETVAAIKETLDAGSLKKLGN
jgi:hypothetical protein